MNDYNSPAISQPAARLASTTWKHCDGSDARSQLEATAREACWPRMRCTSQTPFIKESEGSPSAIVDRPTRLIPVDNSPSHHPPPGEIRCYGKLSLNASVMTQPENLGAGHSPPRISRHCVLVNCAVIVFVRTTSLDTVLQYPLLNESRPLAPRWEQSPFLSYEIGECIADMGSLLI